MKYLPAILGMLMLIGVIGAGGCTVVRELPPSERTEKLSGPELELCRKLIEAFITDDADGFVALLPAESRQNFNAQQFRATRKSVADSVGEPISYEYVTTLELPDLHPNIWKIRFKRENAARDKEFTSEILFRIITGTTKEGGPVILGFQFL